MPSYDYLYIFSFGYSVFPRQLLLSADSLCKQFGPWSAPTNIGAELDTDRFPPSDSVFARVFEKVNFGKKSADDIKVLK